MAALIFLKFVATFEFEHILLSLENAKFKFDRISLENAKFEFDNLINARLGQTGYQAHELRRR